MFGFISVYQREKSIKVGIQDTKQLLCCGLLRNLRKENTRSKFPTKLVNLKTPICQKKRIKKFPVCCKPLWSLELRAGLKSWAARMLALHPVGIWDSRLGQLCTEPSDGPESPKQAEAAAREM